MRFQRQHPWDVDKHESPYRWNALATYNAERARGIVHTEEWKAKMVVEQEHFNAEQAQPA